MGYREVQGFVLRRRNAFEDDQFITLLTPDGGGLDVRAPHARKSQKTYCGRLEPPNWVEARVYRSREHSRWVLTRVDIQEVYSDLLGDRRLRYQLWPLLSLFGDLFPEGEQPGPLVHRLRRGLDMLGDGFEPPLLVADRLLVAAAERAGIGLVWDRCTDCGRDLSASGDARPGLNLDRGLVCAECRDEQTRVYPAAVFERYRMLRDRTWEEVCAQTHRRSHLEELERLMYRMFHYHFEISLDALRVRKQL